MLSILDFYPPPPAPLRKKKSFSAVGRAPSESSQPGGQRSNEGCSERTAGFRLGSRHHRRQEPRLGSEPPMILQKLPPGSQRVASGLHLPPPTSTSQHVFQHQSTNVARCLRHAAKYHCIAEPASGGESTGSDSLSGGCGQEPWCEVCVPFVTSQRAGSCACWTPFSSSSSSALFFMVKASFSLAPSDQEGLGSPQSRWVESPASPVATLWG